VAQEPTLESRTAQPYVAIRRRVTETVQRAVDGAFPELFGWLGEHGVTPSGAPFIRFLEIDAEGDPLELEVGVPVDGEVEAAEPVRADVLPAGRYVTFLHAGPYRSTTEPDLAAARATVHDWGEGRGIRWDGRGTERGSALGCYVEHYLVGPVEEPDHSRWRTELAYLVAG
jgi:GyrI-like small molecule binding protein